MSSFSFFKRIHAALFPKTNIMASMRLDFPEPFGPTIAEKH